MGRFINADDTSLLGANGDFISYNLFAYCLNNPVNRFDSEGTLSFANCIKAAIGIVATVAAVGLTVATGGTALPVIASVAMSTVVSGAVGYATGGVEGMEDGIANGLMWGGLSALGGAAFKYLKVKAATTGTSNSIGKAGEKLAGIDPSKKQPIQINGRIRIPDALTDTSLIEVKNVKYISNTLQLRDFADYAHQANLTLELYVRPTTKVAQTVIDAGWNLNYLW